VTFPKALAHEPITRIAEGVFIVRGSFQMGMMRIGRTMTIVQSEEGLVVLNAVRLDDNTEAELLKLGPVRHLAKLSDSHGVDEPYYVDRFKPEIWVAERSKDARVKGTRRLGPDSPIPGAVIIGYPGTGGWCEHGLWIPNGGGTLITTDALQNHVDSVGASWFGKFLTSMMGFKGGVIVAPMWQKYQKVQGSQVTAAFAEVTPLQFENLITGHGPAICGGADQIARAAVQQAAGAG
jgi:hypothetical protein